MKLLIALIFFLMLAVTAWPTGPAAAGLCPSAGADPVCMALPQVAPVRAPADCAGWVAVLPGTTAALPPLAASLPPAPEGTAIVPPPLPADHWRPPRVTS